MGKGKHWTALGGSPSRTLKKLLLKAYSLWMISALAIGGALLAARLVRWVDSRTGWRLLNFGVEGARGVLAALAGSLLTFVVFTFSILVLSVQMASGQLTPRIIARLVENKAKNLAVGAFVFAWVFTVSALGRVEDRVPQLMVVLAVLMGLASIGIFLFLMQKALQAMRPVTILTRVAQDTRAVIESVYPVALSKPMESPGTPDLALTEARQTVTNAARSGSVLALDFGRLADIAWRADCTIEIVPQVGDFLPKGDELYRIHGPGAESVNPAGLKGCVALGPERTMEQDPAFGFRIIVDIAVRALSPGINDPTTAVLAIDQLHHLLQLLGKRRLADGLIRDASGKVRLVYRTPDWEDFVTLAATEIRVFGAGSPQVTRRLEAMFEHLLRTVPEERIPALRTEMALLARTVERAISDAEDRALALKGDLQGFGSRPRGRDEATP